MLRALMFAAPLAALSLTACGGTAVLVARTPNGGVLGLDGDHAEAMADARRQMSEHCAGAYRILGEQEAVTGELKGRTFTEYQVEFACGVEPDRPATPAPRR